MPRFVVAACCFAACAAVLVPGWVSAQDAAPGARPQPGQALAQPPETPPELLPILDIWEQKSAQMNRVEGDFQRYEYDKVFQSRKDWTGKYYYEGPDKGRMDFLPDKNIPASPGNQVTVAGVNYTREAGAPRSWFCNGEAILDIDHVDKTYNRVDIPPQYRGERIGDGPLPFLFGMRADKIKQRYFLDLGSMHRPPQQLHIVAYPRLPEERKEYQKAEVILDGNTYMPLAIKLWDPSGNTQNVYTFLEHKKKDLPWLTGAPWNKDLSRYKLLHHYTAPPPEDAQSGVRGAEAASGAIFR